MYNFCSGLAVAFIVQSLQYQHYRLAFREPFQTALGKLSPREGFIVEIRDRKSDDGVQHISLGESAPLEGFGMESLTEPEKVLSTPAGV